MTDGSCIVQPIIDELGDMDNKTRRSKSQEEKITRLYFTLIALRTGKADDGRFVDHIAALQTKNIALSVLNIPNDIRLDDNFESSCPPAVRAPFLDILYKTFKHISENSSDSFLCSALADHAHNIPYAIVAPRTEQLPDLPLPLYYYSLREYWESDCTKMTGDRLRGNNPKKKDYGEKIHTDLFAREWKEIEPHALKAIQEIDKLREERNQIKQETDDEGGDEYITGGSVSEKDSGKKRKHDSGLGDSNKCMAKHD